MRYFQLLYQARDLDEAKIQPLRAALDYPEVAKRFRLIEDDTIPVVVRYRGPVRSDRTVDNLLRIARGDMDVPRETLRRLQPYLVDIWRRALIPHEQAGRLSEVRPGLWEWLGGYDSVRGITGSSGDPAELVV